MNTWEKGDVAAAGDQHSLRTLLPLRHLLFLPVASECNGQSGHLTERGCLGDVSSRRLMDVFIRLVVLYVGYGISSHPRVGCQE